MNLWDEVLERINVGNVDGAIDLVMDTLDDLCLGGHFDQAEMLVSDLLTRQPFRRSVYWSVYAITKPWLELSKFKIPLLKLANGEPLP